MAKQLQEAYILAATRTPVGKAPRGALRHTRPDSLLAHVLKSVLMQAPQIDSKRIEDVIVGCAMPEYEQGMNVARIGLLLAGLPNTVAGMTINRFCSSGLNAVSIAADRIRTGEADIVIAAGTESMSMIPMLGRLALNAEVFAKDENIGIAYGMGLTAERVATGWKVSREEQDAFALASHRKALAAQASGEFSAEISPYPIRENVPDLASGRIVARARSFDRDEGPRSDTSSDGLAKLKPVFAAKGSVTAGNSSQTSDGAGAAVVVSERVLQRIGPHAARALGRLRGRRCRARGHGRWPAGGDSQGSAQHGHPPGPDRLDRIERGLRCAEPCRHQGARSRPGKGESVGRGDRSRPSSRCDRRGANGDHRARAETAPAEIRHGHDVRRDRHGRGRHI